MSPSLFPFHDEIADFLQEATVDSVGLWQISESAKDFFGQGEQAREQALDVVRQLILKGVAAGNLAMDGSFVAWPDQAADSVVARIRQEWVALGKDPTINDVAWFAVPRGTP